MVYTAQQLITRSWYLSGIIARGLQFPTGDQINDGLQLLNNLLDYKQIETDLIPYWQYITFPCVPNQEYYYLPYVAAIESSTFDLSEVRYPMVNTSRTNYFGSSRVNNISTLPFSWNYDRAMGGGNLSLYFLPDQAYIMKMQVKIFLVDVQLNTDLMNISEMFQIPSAIPYYTVYAFIRNSNQGYDSSYLEYLRYALAKLMCSEYGIMFNPESEKILMGYQRKLMYVSAPDLSLKKVTILSADRQSGYNWGDVNIGHGWRV